MSESGKASDDGERNVNTLLNMHDVQGVVNNRSTLYRGGLIGGGAIFICSFMAPSLPSMLFGILAGLVVLFWSGANLLAQKSILARSSKLLGTAAGARTVTVRFYEPPRMRGSSLVGSLYFTEANEHRFIAQGIGLHRLVGEQQVSWLEDEADPGFALMKTPNGSCVLFVHPPRPGLPPASALEVMRQK